MFTGLNLFKKQVRALPKPANLFEGLRLPEGFELPDEILLFHHNFCVASPNAHRRYTLVFPLGDMRYCVDEREYDISEGNVLLIRPFQMRFMLPESAGYERFFITFQLQNEQAYLPEGELFKMTGSSLDCLQRIPEAFSGGHATELALMLYELLTSLAPGRQDNAPPRLSREIALAVEYINNNLHTVIENRNIAARISMSPTNMCRRFRHEMGVSVHDYIARQRLEFACYYLQKTRMRVEEIAARCGFGSVSSFSHFFKSAAGTSPMQYRRTAMPPEEEST